MKKIITLILALVLLTSCQINKTQWTDEYYMWNWIDRYENKEAICYVYGTSARWWISCKFKD